MRLTDVPSRTDGNVSQPHQKRFGESEEFLLVSDGITAALLHVNVGVSVNVSEPLRLDQQL